MTWNDLTAQLSVRRRGAGDPVVTDVTCDSRTAGPGSVYVSIPGFKVHGDTFIKSAVDKGASAVLSENPQPGCPVAWAQIENARKVLGIASRAVYGIDLSKIRCVGITGTNGKTTTAHLVQALLSLVAGRDAVWMFGTIRYYAAGKIEAAHNTTPESAEIFRDLAKADKKPAAIVMEVSSHSLALNRVAGLLFDCALFTNLTQDHLDFHASMEDYYQAKKMLFTDYLKPNGSAVINTDDPYGAAAGQGACGETRGDVRQKRIGRRAHRGLAMRVGRHDRHTGHGRPPGNCHLEARRVFQRVQHGGARRSGRRARHRHGHGAALLRGCRHRSRPHGPRAARRPVFGVRGLRAHARRACKRAFHGEKNRRRQAHLRVRLRRRQGQNQASAHGPGRGRKRRRGGRDVGQPPERGPARDRPRHP